MRKDKSRDAGGISEADMEYVKNQKAPSKVESAAESIADVLSMGSASKGRKAKENREREEFASEYNKSHDIEPTARHWEHR